MLTVEEVADRLKVTPRTVYRWIDDGKLKALKIGGVVRVTEEDYQSFINNKAD
jgi:excisionase family DNA binding protein